MGHSDHMDSWHYLFSLQAFMFQILNSGSTICSRISAMDFPFRPCHQSFSSWISTVLSVLIFVVILFAFLFVDLFDTIGTLVGVSSKAGMLDENGKLPRIKGALLADAIATTAGAALGTSTATTFVESASGVTEGGRTGSDSPDNRYFVRPVCFCHRFSCNSFICIAPALHYCWCFIC